MFRPRPIFDLVVVSGLILFLELACIRWFPAHVLFLSFFTNTVLLACFVGMSIGCLLADRPARLIRWTPALLSTALAAGTAVDLFRRGLERHLTVGDQANPDVVFFGAEASSVKGIEFVVPVEVFAGLFYLLVAGVMIGPGQELGRAFTRVAGRSFAYSLNLVGSLVGIGLFAACSDWQLPPTIWFAISVLGLGYVLLRQTDGVFAPATRRPIVGFLLLAMVLALTVRSSGWLPWPADRETHWSPYYRIDYTPSSQYIVTNLIGHQVMIGREGRTVEPYAIPHLFRRDVHNADGNPAWPAYQRVLIIGAGSGNDLARALVWCGPTTRIDAVEIDPVIQSLGAKYHPDRPYQDPRVTLHLNDGRNFLRTAPDAEYDLVIFALVDSLVLHSGYSNLRLESFLFTTESMRDVRRVLKPTGIAAVYNYFRQGWIAVRLRDTLKGAFGAEPVVLTDPPRESITLTQFNHDMMTIFIAGSEETIEPLRTSFTRNGNAYWVPGDRGVTPGTPCQFAVTAPDPLPAEGVSFPTRPAWLRLQATTVGPSDDSLPAATDDWPFLYARQAGIPGLTWRGMLIVIVLSAALWWVVAKLAGAAPTTATAPTETALAIRSFFLGAGFMLVETKAVVQMALLFGSTWKVNTVVFAAVLVMSLIGNLYASRVKPTNLLPYYLGLIVALAVNVVVPLDAFLGLSPAVQVMGACALAFAPVAFAGVIFASSFARSNNPDRVFGANVAGALVGGLAENASMLLGFRYLLFLAIGFYLISALVGGRRMSGQPERREV